MQKKDSNINKYLHGKLPDPEVPADDAWNQMNGLIGTASTGFAVKGFLQKLAQFKWALLSGTAVTVVSSVIVIVKMNGTEYTAQKNLSPKTPTTEQAQVSNTIRKDSISVNQDKPIVVYDNEQEGEKPVGSLPIAGPEDTSLLTEQKANAKSISEKTASLPAATNTFKTKNKPKQKEESRHANRERSSFPKNDSRSDRLSMNNNTIDSSPPDIPRPLQPTQSVTLTSGMKVLQYLTPHSNIHNPYKIPQSAHITPPKNKAPIAAVKPERASDFQIGLDWNLNSSLKHTDYVFAGKDSISRPALLLIPGIFVSKSWQKHLLTFTVSASQTHFENNSMISHEVDSVYSTDSAKTFHTTYNNIRFLKAKGLNFSIYYHYQFSRMLAAGAGASYSIFTNALIRKELEDVRGQYFPEGLQTIEGKDVSQNINPRLFAVKAGILFNPGRFQAGFNVILPVSNISKSAEFPLRSLNGQVFLRFSIFRQTD